MEIAQLTTTRVAPIDFTTNAVAEPRIFNLRDSDEDLSQVQNVIQQCSIQNRSTEQTFSRSHPRPDDYGRSANAVFNFCS